MAQDTSAAMAGVLWMLVSPTAAFLYAAGWMVIALVLLLRLRVRQATEAAH